MKTLYIPRWLYPNNLGDSICSLSAVKILKTAIGDQPLQVVTDLALRELIERENLANVVRGPDKFELSQTDNIYRVLAMDPVLRTTNTRVIYPEWHPGLWSEWNSKFEFYSNHPTLNLITLNYMMQLHLLDLVDTCPNLDYRPQISLPKIKADHPVIGIVPDTKKSNRANPHPGCDGIGYRLGGPNGKQYWTRIIDAIKQNIPNVEIVEFAREPIDSSNTIVKELPFLDLAKEVKRCDMGVLSDGGLHHMFIATRTPTVLLGAQKINKPEFFKVRTDTYNKQLYNCRCDISNLHGWKDLTHCDLKCEQVNIEALCSHIIEEYNNVK